MLFFLIIFFVGCDSVVNITRFPMYSYYFENGKASDVRLIGTCLDCSSNSLDTLIDTTVSSNESIFIMSGIELRPPYYNTPLFKSNGIEKCDSVYVLENGRQVNIFANPYTVSSDTIVDDSIYLLFQFNDLEVYALFETIEYKSDGPQPEEKKFKYMLD